MKSDYEEALAIIDNLSRALTLRLPSSGRAASDARLALGDLHADLEDIIDDQMLGTKLQNCFALIRTAGGTIDTFDDARIAMLDEEPIYPLGLMIKSSSVVFSLVEQGNLIAVMTFASREAVQLMINRMVKVIDVIKLDIAELLNGIDYQNVIRLSAALMQHLSATERQLPRVVRFSFGTNFPALYLAHYIYHDASRSDELIAENRVIHPAFFMSQNVKALSR